MHGSIIHTYKTYERKRVCVYMCVCTHKLHVLCVYVCGYFLARAAGVGIRSWLPPVTQDRSLMQSLSLRVWSLHTQGVEGGTGGRMVSVHVPVPGSSFFIFIL